MSHAEEHHTIAQRQLFLFVYGYECGPTACEGRWRREPLLRYCRFTLSPEGRTKALRERVKHSFTQRSRSSPPRKVWVRILGEGHFT